VGIIIISAKEKNKLVASREITINALNYASE